MQVEQWKLLLAEEGEQIVEVEKEGYPEPKEGECGKLNLQGVPCLLKAGHEERGIKFHEGYGTVWE